jgi:hypothetical protein
MVRHFFKGNKMANRFFQQFFFGLNHYPVWIEGSAAIGASGATSALKGSGVKSLTRKAAGVYELKLEDNYSRFLSFQCKFVAPVTGSAVTGGSFVTGTLYVIQSLGSTTQAQWETAGLSGGNVAAVGDAFVALGAGEGTGTVKAVGTSAVFACELVGDPQASVGPTTPGAVLLFKCIDASGAAVDPASGSQVYFEVTYRNSTVKGKGE